MGGSTGVRLDSLRARRLLANLSITELAQKANLSEWEITMLEEGGNCTMADAQRIMNALAPPTTLIANTLVSPTNLLLVNNSFVTGDVVVISGATGGISLPDINGTWTVTLVGGTFYSIPVDAQGGTVYDAASGTVRLDGASVGLSIL